jgi:hypothetical protein
MEKIKYIDDNKHQPFPIKQKGIHHCLCIGSTQSGKSKFLFKYFYENKRFFDYVIVFSCVAKDDQEQGDMDYSFTKYLKDDYSPELLQKIYLCQKNKKKKRPMIAIVFDDCNVNFNHDEFLNWLMPKARHYNINMFFSVQYFSMTSPQIRANCDMVFITNIHGFSNRKQVFDYISHYFHDNIREFYDLLEVNKKTYDVLLFNKNKKDNDENIYVYHYDYLRIPKFKI